jgi:hypothetical protein
MNVPDDVWGALPKAVGPVIPWKEVYYYCCWSVVDEERIFQSL